MNPKYIGLNEQIGKIIKAPGDQSRIVAIAAAFAASAQGHLPSSPVDNLLGYYSLQVFPSVAEKLSEIGESVVFGTKSALEYTQQFWQMRYYAAFPAKFADVFQHRMHMVMECKTTKSLDITSLLCGGQFIVSEEMSDFMNKYKVEISTIAMYIIGILLPDVEGQDSPSGF